MNRKDRRRARALGQPMPTREDRPVAMATGPTTWSVRRFALFGAVGGLAIGAALFGAELTSGSRDIAAESVGKCLGAIVLGALAGAFMAIGRNVASR